jgi:regulator of protease activity HflC (stomatin/prohibitin superfamily)
MIENGNSSPDEVVRPEDDEGRRDKPETKTQRAQRIRRELNGISDSPQGTFYKGAVVTGIITGIAWVILGLADMFLEWNIFNFFTAMGSATLLVYYVFFKNIHQIEVGHKGVLLWFGEREKEGSSPKSRRLLNEGYLWTLPSPIEDVIVVDVQERTERIDDKVFFAIGSAENATPNGSTDQETEQAEMLVNVAIQYMIKDPFKFLDTGESVITDGLHTVVVAATRIVSADLTPSKFMQMKEELGDEVDKTAEGQSDRWGIEILDVNTTYIRFANEETRLAYERSTIEARQKDAETIETDNVIFNVGRYLELGLSAKEAVWAFQRERGKVSASEVHFSGNEASGLVAAAEILSKGNNSPTPPRKKGGK